jgi:hypothetical protein
MVTFRGDQTGWLTLLSPTRQIHPQTGKVVEYRYRKDSQLRVHKADLPNMGESFEVNVQAIIPVLEPVLVGSLPDEVSNNGFTVSPSDLSPNTHGTEGTSPVPKRGKVKKPIPSF